MKKTLAMFLMVMGAMVISIAGKGAANDVLFTEGVNGKLGREKLLDPDNIVSVVVMPCVTNVRVAGLFFNCANLRSVAFLGNSITFNTLSVYRTMFDGCYKLNDVLFGCPPIDVAVLARDLAYINELKYPKQYAAEWEKVLGNLNYGGRWIRWEGEYPDITEYVVREHVPPTQIVHIVTTNVVVNYVLNSVKPEFTMSASQDTGFVNVVAEVKGGCVAVPSTWIENYPTFTEKFGLDFTKALTMKTGKKDGAGNDMLVWQDYVAGTDPTKEDDVFKASITIVDGKVTISYTPELDAERRAMRKYTTWGKKSLLDLTWREVPEGHESEYNFFKISVEMK